MYNNHFGIERRIFSGNVAGADVFVGPQVANVLQGINKALTAPDAVVTLTGPVGCGKSTAVAHSLAAINGNNAIVRIGRFPLQRGELLPVPQDGASASLAPKIDRDTARIDWAMGARAVARRIRAFDPVPGAWTTLGDLEVKLFGAHPGQDTGAPGVILRTEPALVVGTGDGSVEISEVQPSGKRRMPATEWHRGRAALAGERFA